MHDYPENFEHGKPNPGIFLGLLLIGLIFCVYAFIHENVTTVTVWVPAHTARVPDITRPSIIDDMTFYNEYEDVFVPGYYERQWRWKK